MNIANDVTELIGELMLGCLLSVAVRPGLAGYFVDTDCFLHFCRPHAYGVPEQGHCWRRRQGKCLPSDFQYVLIMIFNAQRASFCCSNPGVLQARDHGALLQR
jgi:hypothetical protein